MTGWTVERVVHFAEGDLVHDGFVHFGFHDRAGRHYLIEHQRHFVGLIGSADRLEWTVAARPVFADVPNIPAELDFPMFVDSLADGSLVISNLGNGRLYRVYVAARTAHLLLDGRAHGMVDMGNCVVDDDGRIWINEVTGCRIWRIGLDGRVIEVLGTGRPGFHAGLAPFEDVTFGRIYDIRRGPDTRIYVLDSGNFAVRAIDVAARQVVTIAGTGKAGYSGDGGDARTATFGSDPAARFDGPISLSLDESGNVYVGDRFNQTVRMIDSDTGRISTIAGRRPADDEAPNDPDERDPRQLNLPQISSMDYFGGRLLVPTDLTGNGGDLAVLRPPEPR